MYVEGKPALSSSYAPRGMNTVRKAGNLRDPTIADWS